MKEFINLCNQNDGFISAILTLVTIFLTIKLSLLPYKKKMNITMHGEVADDGNYLAHFYLANLGNCPLNIECISFYFSGQKDSDFDFYPSDYNPMLMPQETKDITVRIDKEEVKWGKSCMACIVTNTKSFKYSFVWALG